MARYRVDERGRRTLLQATRDPFQAGWPGQDPSPVALHQSPPTPTPSPEPVPGTQAEES